MNAFIGISRAQTTNLAAPLATVDLPVSTAERQPKSETPLCLTVRADLLFALKDHQ